MSLLFPPSRCPYCLSRLKAFENVPVLGWLMLRGQCNHCRSPISIRYPLVELATGLLFILVFSVYGLSGYTLGYWCFFSWLLALALIDIDTMLLPHVLTKSGLLAGLGFQIVIGFVRNFNGLTGLQFLTDGIIGAVLGIWIFDLIRLLGAIALKQDAMGGGDGKLMSMIGAWLGWKMMLIAAFLGCALGAVIGSAAIALGLLGRRQPMPFGPYLVGGAMISSLYGQTLLRTYQEWMGLG
jgi:leader peptidase (prepilin peptidase) / N-methyltransferase